MAQINSTTCASPASSRKKRGVMRMVKHNLKVDMTPMVDLGFLLITFFVITTEMSRPTTMDLFMPKEKGEPMELGESNAITVLLDDNKIYYYNGKWEDAYKLNLITQTQFSGSNELRKDIGDKQRQLDMMLKSKEKRDGLMLLIKPGSKASYKNVVDVLDEATISRVKRYAIIRMSEEEKEWLKQN